MSDVTNLDPTAVQRLQRLGGDEFVVKMIDLFAGYAREKLAAAHQAHAAGELEGVADAVHPIKSSAGNVGAKHVQDLARQSNGEPLAGLLEELDRAFLASMKDLEQLKLALSSPTDVAR